MKRSERDRERREWELAKELAGSLAGDREIARRLLCEYRHELLDDLEKEHEALKKRFDVICVLAGIGPKAAMHVRVGGMPKLSSAQREWAERTAREAVDES